mgnify:CR=1 FL=1
MQITFTFDQNDYAFVQDHCPEDYPVLPFVSAVDTFYTVLQEHVGPCVLEDVRLVKGIILPDFKTFEMMVEIDEDKKTIQLIGEDSVVHYKAIYEQTSVFPDVTGSQAQPLEPVSAGTQKKELDPGSAAIKDNDLVREDRSTTLMGDYEFLFHGPMLQSIVSIQTDTPDKEAIGLLKTAKGMEWSKTDWFFDPFACDGALQMGCQLAFMSKQKASLPSKIKRAVFYKQANDSASGFPGVTDSSALRVEPVSTGIQNVALDPGSAAYGLVRETRSTEVLVHLIFQKMSGLQYIFDAHLFDNKHAPICSLEGVESYFRLFK